MVTEDVICRACLYKNESNEGSNWKNSAENFSSLKLIYKELTELEVCYFIFLCYALYFFFTRYQTMMDYPSYCAAVAAHHWNNSKYSKELASIRTTA
jgi:hypothetical protein